MKKTLFFLFILLNLIGCNSSVKNNENIQEELYGTLENGREIKLFTLKNASGMQVKIINYGGIITSIIVPDKQGNFGEIVLGFDNLKDYETKSPYFGALIGRYGNRIANGKFSLDGKEYNLAQNNGENHLHGGILGFDKVTWEADTEIINGESVLSLTYTSNDGEEGYPGNLVSKVIYTLTKDNELKINYSAETDKKTIVNLTQHSYFNLAGTTDSTILNHELNLYADNFIPIDEGFIPIGEIVPVKDTPFDFTIPKKIGKDIEEKNEQLSRGLGYDHCWVVNGEGMRKAAQLSHAPTGRIMEVFTDEPGIQFYTGNFLDGTNAPYRTGLCLETQHFPDSPNQQKFPTVVLEPGQKYESNTIFKFGVK
ncbi:MAG: hypothetical protein RIR51_1559 [Bacteroidota bacterium]